MTNPTITNSNNTSTSTINSHTSYTKEISIYITCSIVFFCILNIGIIGKYRLIKSKFKIYEDTFKHNKYDYTYIIFIILSTFYFIGRSHKLKKKINEKDNVGDDYYKEQIKNRVKIITVLNIMTLLVHVIIIYLIMSNYINLKN